MAGKFVMKRHHMQVYIERSECAYGYAYQGLLSCSCGHRVNFGGTDFEPYARRHRQEATERELGMDFALEKDQNY
jgi:hypothetical protein